MRAATAVALLVANNLRDIPRDAETTSALCVRLVITAPG